MSRFETNAIRAAWLAGVLLVTRSAFADALVPIVAIFNLPLSLLSIFWIAPLEAAVIRLKEPGLRFRDLTWDLWLANWLSLAAGVAAVTAVMAAAVVLDMLGVVDERSAALSRMLTILDPASNECPSRTYLGAALTSLVWVAVTFPITIYVESRFLAARWWQRGELAVYSPFRAVTLANAISYALLVAGLFRILVLPAMGDDECGP